MKRNSTTLFFESPGATTPIPWVDNAPDFTGFTEPTLSVLQTAWQEFVDGGGEPEIIPDPEPFVQPTPPNWDGFYDGLIMSETYNYLLQQTVPNPSISGVMTAMGVAILQGQSDPGNPNRLAALQAAINAVLGTLNAIGLPLSESRLVEVRNALDENGFINIDLA